MTRRQKKAFLEGLQAEILIIAFIAVAGYATTILG